jgi:putative endonuclease
MSFGAHPPLCSGLAPQDDGVERAQRQGGWAYILLCRDKSYYVGSTSYLAVETRVAEHNDRKNFGYTSSRVPVYLAWSKWFDDLSDAHAVERRLKGWSRAKKQALISGDEDRLIKLSKRRAGRPTDVNASPEPTRRQSTVEFQSAGARHPEARPGAKRKGAPKDE